MNPPRASPDLIKPAGPVDPGFTAVSIRSTAGKPIALLANYSLHYVGGIPARQVSADYFGEFASQTADRLRVEGAGSEFVAILSNGTSGDVNNIDFEHAATRMEPFERIRQVAGRLAQSALHAYREAKYRDWVALAGAQRELPLKFRKPSPEMTERARRVLAQPDERNLPQHAKAYAERVLKLLDGPDLADVKVGALKLGDLAIAAIAVREGAPALRVKFPHRNLTAQVVFDHLASRDRRKQRLGAEPPHCIFNRLAMRC